MRTRDQERARYAYSRVRAVPDNERADYSVVVNDLGATIMRSGLAAAVAYLERRGKQGGTRLLNDLAAAGVPGVEARTGAALADAVRSMDAGAYMMATREILKLAMWFKRAMQALDEG